MNIFKDSETLTIGAFEKLTGVRWLNQLEFESSKLYHIIQKKQMKYSSKGLMSREQEWLGRYFKNEILGCALPDVSIRWVSLDVGWGVFAERDFKKMEFISEYTGSVRKKAKRDSKNAFCFEYPIYSGMETPYTIDAMEQGGVSRFINHSDQPNLTSSLATVNEVGHIILYTKTEIAKGQQLCYDYGPFYWSKRTKPLSL